MNWKVTLIPALALFMITSVNQAQPGGQPDSLQEFQKHAAKFKCVLSLPKFEVTTNQLRASVKQTIATGNAALDKIGALDPRKVSFENTVRALDDMGYQVS